MSRIQIGRLFLKLKKKQIDVPQFLKQYVAINSSDLNNFDKTDFNGLGGFKDHEERHGNFLKKHNIKYSYYLAKDKQMAGTVPDWEDFQKHACCMGVNEFIEFLKEYHNPLKLAAEKLDGTDYLVFQILSGVFEDKEIENWVVNERFKK